MACPWTPGRAGVSWTASSALAWLKTVASKKTRVVRRYIAGVVGRWVGGNFLSTNSWWGFMLLGEAAFPPIKANGAWRACLALDAPHY